MQITLTCRVLNQYADAPARTRETTAHSCSIVRAMTTPLAQIPTPALGLMVGVAICKTDTDEYVPGRLHALVTQLQMRGEWDAMIAPLNDNLRAAIDRLVSNDLLVIAEKRARDKRSAHSHLSVVK